MQKSKGPETLHFLQNAGILRKSGLNARSAALFCQIWRWLQLKPREFARYEKKHKVNERRESLKLNLFRKVGAPPGSDLKVLKFFPVASAPEFIAYFVRDAVVPHLVDSAWALKGTDIFLHEEVLALVGGAAAPALCSSRAFFKI